MNMDRGNCSADLFVIKIRSVTGTEFELQVDQHDSIATIKLAIGNSLSIANTDFYLIHNYKKLGSGTIASNDIKHGSEMLVVPTVKTGRVQRRILKTINTKVQFMQYITDETMHDFLMAKSCLGFNVRSGPSLFSVRLKFKSPRVDDKKDEGDDGGGGSGGDDDDDDSVVVTVRENRKKRKRERKSKRPRKVLRVSADVCQALMDFRCKLSSDHNITIPDGSTLKVYVRLENAGQTAVPCQDAGSGDGVRHEIDLLTILNALQELLAKRVLSASGEIPEQLETRATDAASAEPAAGNDAALLHQEQVTSDKMRTLLAALKKKKERICAARRNPGTEAAAAAAAAPVSDIDEPSATAPNEDL